MEIILAIIVLAVNLTIFFFLTRAASKSAAKDILADYSTPLDILAAMQRLERQISELQKELARVTASRKENESAGSLPRPGNPQQMAEASEFSGSEESYLIEGPNAYSWVCSHCGQRQPGNRTCCFRCSAVFGSKPL